MHKREIHVIDQSRWFALITVVIFRKHGQVKIHHGLSKASMKRLRELIGSRIVSIQSMHDDTRYEIEVQ